MRRHLLIASQTAAALLCLSAAGSASADIADLSLGAKGFAGGSVFTTPTNIPANYGGLGFAGNAGGFSYGGGLYFEARFIKFVGLELDLVYDKSSIHRKVTYNDVADINERVDITSLRVPILAKGSLPTPFGRLFVLAGLEMVQSQSADPSIDITRGESLIANPAEVKTFIHAKKSNWTNFVAGLGLTIDLPASLELPIELRAAKNLGQASDWKDRVEFTSSSSYTVDAQTSWDFRLGVGLGYQF